MKYKTNIIFLLIIFCLITINSLAQEQKTVEPINWRELVGFLKDIPGWEAEGDPTGQTMSMGMYSATTVEREYTSGDKTLIIRIIDGGLAQLAYAGFNMMRQFEVDTSEEYVKKIEIQGYPGVDRYSYEYNEGTVMLLVAERFLVEIEISEVENTDDAKEAAGALELDKLADLAK